MENRAYALAAGLFTLLLGMGVAAAALWFSGEAVVTRDYLLVSRHPVSGLNVQAPVRYRGVTVGKVSGIRFDPLEPRTILIAIAVEAGTPLTQGSYAQLGSQGVTGLAYVMLDDDGSRPAALAAEGDEPARIEVRQSLLDSFAASGQDMIASFNQVAKRVNALLSEENQKQLVATLRQLDQLSARVVTLANAIDPTLKALPALADDAGSAFRRADTLLAGLDRRLDTFERAARSAEQLAVSGSALSEVLMIESLPRLNLLLDDLQRTSRGLERTLNGIDEQPHSLVFGRHPPPPGPGEAGFAARGGRR